MNKTTIYIIRHGQSEENILEDKNSFGVFDEFESSLSEKGREQAALIAEKLKDVDFDEIYSSDLRRAQETAEAIAKNKNKKVKLDNSIREVHYGKYHGQFSKVQQQVEAAIKLLAEEEKMKYQFEDMEIEENAVDRFTKFIKKITNENSGKTIAVVNHGKIMRLFLIKNGFGKYDEIPRGSLKNTGYFIIESTDGENFKITETFGVEKVAVKSLSI
jgi:broad specificity phosphatase PhoE